MLGCAQKDHNSFCTFLSEFTSSNVVLLCKRIKQKKKKKFAPAVGSVLAYHLLKSHIKSCLLAFCTVGLPGVVEDDDDSPFGALEKVDM